ncbi:MAG: gliding motility-associated C-terminal domain-containing protein [Chryseolinea sp.]
MRRLYAVTFICFHIYTSCAAQIDTEFWFAPPEVTEGHGDRPVYLRISTQDQEATIRITQPAANTTNVFVFTIPATTTRSIELERENLFLETNIPDSVMKTGLHILSSTPITAYYEQASTLNAEIFVLKGKNALGNRFIIPWQDVYANNIAYRPVAYASFDVVATQNNTVVTVVPTKPVQGHEKESTITIRLNKGETYSFKKPSLLASMNFSGTVVTSSKPIAITIKDDSVEKGPCRDLLGDQLIPVKVTGLEYIVPRGFLDVPEYLFVMATEDDTDIFISGSSSPVAHLDMGESYRREVTAPALYVVGTKKIYVLHVTGFGCEVGMAILPPINCTGSKLISFTRSTAEFFGMNLLVKKPGIHSFKLSGNGVETPVPSSMFAPVQGTNDEWYTAQISYTTSEVPVNQASVISNDGYSFQTGIINGNAVTTCRYGYFSSYSTLFIGDDFAICEGDLAVIDAGTGKDSYVWNTGATTQSIEVKQSGIYKVTVRREDCILSDSVRVEVRNGAEDLGPDVAICEGATTHIDGKPNFTWLWSNGSTDRYLRTKEPGKFWINVVDNIGCRASDTIQVTRFISSFDPRVDITLDYVSVDTADASAIDISWSIQHPELLQGSIASLFKQASANDQWQLYGSFADTTSQIHDPGNHTSGEVYRYYLTLADRCGKEYKATRKHNTVLLTGAADSLTDIIDLRWNGYADWTEGVKHYEIWRKLDEQHTYVPFATVSDVDKFFNEKIAADGFEHRYIIRAIERNGRYESWSNPLQFEFRHHIDVPNVFTPNGDDYNQYFFIPKIELYKESELIVLDRWGDRVYQARPYTNGWDGANVNTGVYFYTLNLHRNREQLKGTVTVLR